MKVIEFKSDYRNQGAIASADPLAIDDAGVRFGDECHGSGCAEAIPVQAQTQAVKRHSLGAWILLAFLRFYIVCLSPVFGGACKYYPSCSNYAVEAVAKHGARRGFVLAAKRLMRCRPFTKGGFDPVPDDIPHAKRTGRASRKLQVVSGTEIKIRATERRML